MKLQGSVQSGEGKAAFWLEKDADVYELWTGRRIIPGSLNVRLPHKFDWDAPEIAPFRRIHSLVPYGGNRDICLVPCEIYTREACPVEGYAWSTTNAAADTDYHVLEIIASVNLRQTLQLEDGTLVTINIPLPWNA